MRNAFADEVTLLAANNSEIVLLAGDIGNRLFDTLQKQSPKQFINCGIAEANMMGVAAGMALGGLRPITYTIAPFTTTRCLEQIKIDVAYHEAPVVIVGTGSGFSYASLGPTHHSLEDFAILKPIPNLRVLAPWDPPSLRSVLRQSLRDAGPTYIRIGKKGEKQVLPIDKVANLGRLTRVLSGSGVALVAAGTIADEAVIAAQKLQSLGISPTLDLAHTLKPLPEEDLARLCKSHRLILVIEEHYLSGGFGESCAIFAQKTGCPGTLKPLGVPDRFFTQSGSQHFARVSARIDSDAIVGAVMASLVD